MKYTRKRYSHKSLYVYITLIVMWFILRAFTNVFADPKGAEQALLDANYHPIELGGFRMLACSHGDLYATEFTAYSPDSSRFIQSRVGCGVQGVVQGKHHSNILISGAIDFYLEKTDLV